MFFLSGIVLDRILEPDPGTLEPDSDFRLDPDPYKTNADSKHYKKLQKQHGTNLHAIAYQCTEFTGIFCQFSFIHLLFKFIEFFDTLQLLDFLQLE